MKIIFGLIFVFLYSHFYSAEILVKILDGYNHKPVSGAELSVINFFDEKVSTYYSDENGLIYLKKKKKLMTVEVKKMDLYVSTKYYLQEIKGSYIIFLYPNEIYEKKIELLEDSLYGKVDYSNVKIDENYTPMKNDTLVEFPGGQKAYYEFVRDNSIYPLTNIEMNIREKIYLVFTVQPDGKITHIKPLKGNNTLFICESKRIIRKMPNWIPTKKNQGSIKTKCIMPFNYDLR